MQGSTAGENEIVRIARQVADHGRALREQEKRQRDGRRDREFIPEHC